MSVRPILRWPDPRLRQSCAPVDDVASVEDLVGDMFETMYAAPGRGLAAPQIGVMQRLFVMDTGWKEGDMRPVVCINPEIVAHPDKDDIAEEGCLSIPGVTARVRRPSTITITYTALSGERVTQDMTGADARCAQHEMDHLDGLVHFDRLEASARAQLEAAYLALEEKR